MFTLLLLLYVSPTFSFPIPHTNAPPSQGDDSRSTWNIVQSCLTTIFACTWVAFHPNIPAANDHFITIARRRIGSMFYALMAPEFAILWAMRQWVSARDIAHHFQDHNWTRTQGFFLLMGGFVLYDGDTVIGTLSFDRLCQLHQDGKIEFPKITKGEIEDKSKGDALSKGLVVVQTSWFVAQCMARVKEHLVLTEAELVTMAFAVLNGAMYFLWWDKPVDVRCQVPVHLKVDPPSAIQQKDSSIGHQPSPSLPEKEDVGVQTRQPTDDSCPRATVEPVCAPLLVVNHISPDTSLPKAIAVAEQALESSNKQVGSGNSASAPPPAPTAGPSLNSDAMALTLLKIPVGYEQLATSSNHAIFVPPKAIPFMFIVKAVNDFISFATSFFQQFSSCLRRSKQKTCKSKDATPSSKEQSKVRVIGRLSLPMQPLLDMRSSRFFPEDASRVPTYYSPVVSSTKYLLVSVSAAFFAVIFGAIHCTAWMFTFPSHFEKMLWRSSSLVLVVVPIYWIMYILFFEATHRSFDSKGKEWSTPLWLHILNIFAVFGGSLYIIARVSIFVQAVVSLRDLPSSAYQTVEWTALVPHI